MFLRSLLPAECTSTRRGSEGIICCPAGRWRWRDGVRVGLEDNVMARVPATTNLSSGGRPSSPGWPVGPLPRPHRPGRSSACASHEGRRLLRVVFRMGLWLTALLLQPAAAADAPVYAALRGPETPGATRSSPGFRLPGDMDTGSGCGEPSHAAAGEPLPAGEDHGLPGSETFSLTYTFMGLYARSKGRCDPVPPRVGRADRLGPWQSGFRAGAVFHRPGFHGLHPRLQQPSWERTTAIRRCTSSWTPPPRPSRSPGTRRSRADGG